MKKCGYHRDAKIWPLDTLKSSQRKKRFHVLKVHIIKRICECQY